MNQPLLTSQTPMQHPTDTSQIVIKQASFRETGTYNPAFMRPYQTAISVAHQNQIIEATRGGQTITPAALSGVASEFIRPNAIYQQMAYIDEGWDTPRFRFIIMVDYHSIHQQYFQGTPPKTKIIQGYTSHVGYTPTGAIDPSMVLRFNTITTLRHSVEQTPVGPVVRTHVAQADHVIHDQFRQQNMTGGFPQPYTSWMMRPEDVFRSIGTELLFAGDVSGDLIDTRNTLLNSTITRSKRKNSLTPHYVSEILNNHTRSTYQNSDTVDYSDVMAAAESSVQENSVMQDEFFRELKIRSVNFDQSGTITYGEICSIFPNFDHVAMFSMNPSVQRQQPVHQQGDTEYWNTSTNETIWATSLSHALPAIMMDLMIKQLVFTATNRTMTGEHFVHFLDAHSFVDNLDNFQSYLEHFRWQLIGEVLRGLSMNNQIDYELQAKVDVTGETRITLSIMSGPLIEYATPSFCDGLFIPVVTTDEQNLKTVAYDLSVLSDSLQNNQGNSPYV